MSLVRGTSTVGETEPLGGGRHEPPRSEPTRLEPARSETPSWELLISSRRLETSADPFCVRRDIKAVSSSAIAIAVGVVSTGGEADCSTSVASANNEVGAASTPSSPATPTAVAPSASPLVLGAILSCVKGAAQPGAKALTLPCATSRRVLSIPLNRTAPAEQLELKRPVPPSPRRDTPASAPVVAIAASSGPRAYDPERISPEEVAAVTATSAAPGANAASAAMETGDMAVSGAALGESPAEAASGGESARVGIGREGLIGCAEGVREAHGLRRGLGMPKGASSKPVNWGGDALDGEQLADPRPKDVGRRDLPCDKLYSFVGGLHEMPPQPAAAPSGLSAP
eukprot:scaffold171180_cov30-Tisochrysis_lutea.AAC.5